MGACYINVQFFAIICCKLFLTVLNCTTAIKAWKLPQHRRTHEIQTKDGLDWTAAGIGGSVCVNRLWPVEAGGGGMTKDEALDLALEALEWMVANDDTNEGDEPVERLGGQSWNEYNAYWLDGLNNSRAAITAIKQARSAPMQKRPQNCGTGYCSCVECVMEPEPVQTDAWPCLIAEADFSQNTVTLTMQCEDYKVSARQHWLSTTPPAAQRQWVGLTDEELRKLCDEFWLYPRKLLQAIEAKLRAKNFA
jgi:hypothetical protein